MNVKSIFLFCLLIMAGIVSRADDYSYLTIQKNNTGNDESSVALSSLSKITFSNGAMSLYDASGNRLGIYTLSDLNLMYFSNSATAVESLSVNSESVVLQNGILKINSSAGSKISLFQSSGALVKSLSASDAESEINMSSLPKGIYLLKVNDQVTKVLNK